LLSALPVTVASDHPAGTELAGRHVDALVTLFLQQRLASECTSNKSNERQDQLELKKTFHLLVHADDGNLRLMDYNRNTIQEQR
jgi:hypothetical protein